MTEWKEYKLGEIIQIVGGGTPKTSEPKYWNGNIPWLSVVDFNNGNKFVIDTEKHISQEGLENSSTKLLKKGDIIISARGTVGAIAMLGREMAFNQSCYGIRNSELIDNHYLFYSLKKSINELKQNSHGGVFDTITRETFNTINISLPPLPEQIRIASILSSLDDKIDLLHRENKTLEAMAETLFRQWFIEEAKEDWKENPLGKCIKLVGGGTPKTSEERFWNGNVFWLSGGDIANNHKSFVSSSEKSISEDGLNNSSAKLLPENAMVISARGTVGKYCLLSTPMAFSQSNYGILPIYNDCYFFTYLLVAYHIDELQSAAYGSVFDTITTKTFGGVSVLIPKETSYIVDFEKMIEPYFSKMKQNNKQIQTLIQQRDSLLPKLMSGEVKI
jgi:type I restriction enzyme S subunit